MLPPVRGLDSCPGRAELRTGRRTWASKQGADIDVLGSLRSACAAGCAALVRAQTPRSVLLMGGGKVSNGIDVVLQLRG